MDPGRPNTDGTSAIWLMDGITDGLGCFPVPPLADPGARVTAFTAGFFL